MLTLVLVDHTNSCYHPRALEGSSGKLDVYTESRDDVADRTARSSARAAAVSDTEPTIDLEATYRTDTHAPPSASLRSSLRYVVLQRSGSRDVSGPF